MKVDCTDDVGNRIKGVAVGGAKEGRCSVAGKKDALSTKGRPSTGEVGKGNTPVFFLLVNMRFVAETVDAIRTLGEVTLVVLWY